MQDTQRQILIYLKYKKVHDSYKKSLNKRRFREKYESELLLYESVEKNVERLNLTNIENFKNTNEQNIEILQNRYVEHKKDLKTLEEKIQTIEKLEKQLEKISAKGKEKEPEQEQTKKKNLVL